MIKFLIIKTITSVTLSVVSALLYYWSLSSYSPQPSFPHKEGPINSPCPVIYI